MVRWLRLRLSKAEGVRSIPAWRIKVQGLPPSVRGKAWSLLVLSELNITPEFMQYSSPEERDGGKASVKQVLSKYILF